MSGDAPQHTEPAAPETGRAGSWSLEAPPGAYARVIAWTSGAAWFDALMDVLATTQGEELRRQARVARDTLLRVARADWLAADADTGRGVATAHETVAAELGMSSKTVQRSRLLMERLGFAVTIVEGRYLTLAERRTARAAHGGRQIRAASLRALTMPRRRRAVQNVSLPRRGSRTLTSHVKKYSPTRATARRTAAPRPQLHAKKKEQLRSPGSALLVESPRPLDLQKLAADLMRAARWLDTGQHVGALCDLLTAVGIEPARWRARDITQTMDRYFQERDLVYPERAKRPLAFLRWVLTHAIDPAAPTPGEERARRDAERREYMARRAREREAERQRIANIDHDEVARIIARSNAEIAALNAARRHDRKRNRR